MVEGGGEAMQLAAFEPWMTQLVGELSANRANGGFFSASVFKRWQLLSPYPPQTPTSSCVSVGSVVLFLCFLLCFYASRWLRSFSTPVFSAENRMCVEKKLKKTYLAWEKKRNKTNPNFFLPAVSEHGQDAASVRDADCWLWGVLADSAAAHHHLRVRLEVRLTNRLSLRANFAAKAPEWKVTSEFQQVDGQKIGIWLEKLFYFSTNRASETYPCYWRPREMS